jgi:site-specific DNA recombinase
MGHTYTAKGNRRYRYYVCGKAQQRGWEQCPAPSVPAGEAERFVVEQIKCIGRDPGIVAKTVRQVRRQAEDELQRLQREREALKQQLRDDHAELQRLASVNSNGERTARLAQVQEQICTAERRVTEIDNEFAKRAGEVVNEAEVAEALADFDSVWEALAPREQIRVMQLLIERIEFDGHRGSMSITFRPTGIKSLADELAACQEDAA